MKMRSKSTAELRPLIRALRKARRSAIGMLKLAVASAPLRVIAAGLAMLTETRTTSPNATTASLPLRISELASFLNFFEPSPTGAARLPMSTAASPSSAAAIQAMLPARRISRGIVEIEEARLLDQAAGGRLEGDDAASIGRNDAAAGIDGDVRDPGAGRDLGDIGEGQHRGEILDVERGAAVRIDAVADGADAGRPVVGDAASARDQHRGIGGVGDVDQADAVVAEREHRIGADEGDVPDRAAGIDQADQHGGAGRGDVIHREGAADGADVEGGADLELGEDGAVRLDRCRAGRTSSAATGEGWERSRCRSAAKMTPLSPTMRWSAAR